PTMRLPLLFAMPLLMLASLPAGATGPAAADAPRTALVIHGGAGVIERGSLEPDTEQAIRAALRQALDAGGSVLDGGGSALDAVEIGAARREPDTEQAVRAVLQQALDAGESVLDGGGSALDAVEAAVLVLEESPHFNAGRGAVFNAAGGHELDASVMEGHTRRAGAVAGVTTVRNPIRLARAVMEHSPDRKSVV